MIDAGDDQVLVSRTNDSEVLVALSSMSQGAGRDFLAEQEVHEFNTAETKKAQRKLAREDMAPVKQVGTLFKKQAAGIILPVVKKTIGKKADCRVPVALTLEEELEQVQQRHQTRPSLQPKPIEKADKLNMKAPWEYADSDEEIEDLLESMLPKDPRVELPARAVEKGFQRCAIFSCEKNLKPGQIKCACGCMHPDHCICGECGHKCQPNEVLACERCDRVLSHDVRAYQAQAHSEKLALSLSTEKKTAVDELSKSKKTEQLHLEDKVMHLMLDGAGSGAPRLSQ